MKQLLRHSLISFVSLLAAFAPGGAWAALPSVTVNTTVDEFDAVPNAACSLREAVQTINTGFDFGGCVAVPTGSSVITLPAGTYTLTGAAGEDLNVSGDLDITQWVTIQGAGAATTIIDGAGAVTGDRVIHMPTNASLTLDSVTITGGNAAGALLNGVGGGIFSSSGVVVINNSTISNNSSSGNAGGFFSGALTLTNSTVSGNKSGLNYGGFAASSLTMTNSTVSGNSAASWYGGFYSGNPTTVTNSVVSGNSAANIGGVYSPNAISISGSTISNNTATGSYGAIYSGGALTITTSTISGNSAPNFGGIYTPTGVGVTITDSTISGNTASGQFGGVYCNGALTITNSTISGNKAQGAGSAVGGVLSVGALTVTNSTISGNSANSSAGGLRSESGGSITNSTIVGNSAGFGAGVFLFAGTLTFQNTIFAGNTGGNCSTTATFSSLGNNISSDATCNLLAATDIVNSATITGSLGALANNGGPTQTHALLSGSPAIDMGPAACGATDQRGIARPQGAMCDIGAYEAEQFILNTGVSGTGTITGGLITNCPGVCAEYFMKNDVASLTATATAPQTFFGWTGTGSCDGMATNPCSVTMNAAKNVTAFFGTDGLIVTVSGPGSVTSAVAKLDCPATSCAANFAPAGQLETLTATPTGAAVFTGWTVTGGTCVGAATPCDVTVTGAVYLTAKFDLYGCTSPTATNYNASATINDGSCVFPASGGGGGGGGGGLDNQPPYFPGGGSWLYSPKDKATGNGNLPFVWKILTDLDGDTITYYLYACSGPDFTDCKVIDMVIGNGNPNNRIAYGLGASGAALLMVGFGFTRGGRRRLLVALAALALAGSGALIACGAGGGSGNDGVLVSACSQAGMDSVCREKFNLAPGDYQWKVSAEDGRGGQIESEARSLTVQ
ncbi:MAG: right-handed parallel beta-helix repeat-containing protein [Nitrospinota bacterium]|nr:right-handed parallel beta-helix repeat-containing protein [Nitrospinota bacterium]